MRKDYRKHLEVAARQMILVRRVDTLIRLILRTILRTIQVEHAGIFLYDKQKDEYIVKVSKGDKAHKIPEGFAKVGRDNPLIQYFTDKRNIELFDQEFLLFGQIKEALEYNRFKAENEEIIKYLEQLQDELMLHQAQACIPGFFRNTLIGVLFLGNKKDGSKFTPEELGFLSVLASDVVMAIQNAWLFQDLNNQLENNKKLFLGTVTALATAIEAKDKYTSGHTERVVKYSLIIAEELSDNKDALIDDQIKENLRVAALLHDIGKIGVPESVLNKNGPLTDEEFVMIKEHPKVGINILTPIKELKDVIDGVLCHHERFDGRGYPNSLQGEDIPLIPSIIAVADTFDAMTSDRPYRKALSYDVAAAEIEKNKGKQFNPVIVDAFLRAYKNKKI